MDKRKRLFLGFFFLILVTGCATTEVRHFVVLPKTNQITIGEIRVWKDLKTDHWRKKVKKKAVPVDLGSDVYYQRLVKEYKDSLKNELRRNGFQVLEVEEGVSQEGQEGLVLKTRIINTPPKLGGIGGIYGGGILICHIGIFWEKELVFTYIEIVPTTLGGKAPTALKLFVPRAVKQIKEKFSPGRN